MGLLSPKIATKKMVPLCRQMATAYDAGIPIINTLELLAGQERDHRTRTILLTMRDDIRRGATLEEAARAQSKYLPAFFVELLATGEHGGKLDVMLRDLADYFEDQAEIRRQVFRAVIGPSIRIAFAWFLGTFAIRLIGQIANVFRDNGRNDFSLTQYLDEYVEFQTYSMTVFGAVVVVCIVLARLGIFRWISGAVTTHIWPLSMVTKRFALARFFRTLSLLLLGGLRIDHCIEKSAAVVTNPYIQKKLLAAVPPVRQGRTLVEAFGEARYLTPTAMEMLRVGEESGKLEDSLHKVSEYHLKEAKQAVEVGMKVMNYSIFLAVAAVVGYIVITFALMYMQILGDVMDGI